MDLGTYTVLSLRQVVGTEPEACIEAIPRLMPKGYDQNCDQAFKVKWRFPGGAIGEIEADLAARGGWPVPWIPGSWPSMRLLKCTAVHREILVPDIRIGGGEEHVCVRTVTIWSKQPRGRPLLNPVSRLDSLAFLIYAITNTLNTQMCLGRNFGIALIS